jgi:hypothetical protein
LFYYYLFKSYICLKYLPWQPAINQSANQILCYNFEKFILFIYSDTNIATFCCMCICLFVCLMMFNATFNNISVISWWPDLLVEDPDKTTDLSQVTDKLYHIMLYTSPWSRFELTTSVVIDTDCIGSCKSNSLPYDHGHVCICITCYWLVLCCIPLIHTACRTYKLFIYISGVARY